MGASRAERTSVKTLAPPLLENNKIISRKMPFPPLWGPFSSWGVPFFSLCGEFFRLVEGPIYKTFCGSPWFRHKSSS